MARRGALFDVTLRIVAVPTSGAVQVHQRVRPTEPGTRGSLVSNVPTNKLPPNVASVPRKVVRRSKSSFPSHGKETSTTETLAVNGSGIGSGLGSKIPEER